MFMRIKSHEYLQHRAYLLVVDLLHPRMLQTDALLMHRSAEKKELTFDTFLYSQRPLQNLKGNIARGTTDPGY